MSWFYLALAAPFIYAVVNLIDDNLLSFVYRGPSIAAIVGGLFGTIPLLSMLFIHFHAIPTPYSLLATLAGYLLVIFYYFYFKALGSDTPSVVITMLNLVPATIPFFAHYFLHENLLPMQVLGFIIVLASSLAISITDVKRFKFSRAILPTLVSVGVIDVVTLIMKFTYQHASFYPSYMYYSLGIGLGGVSFLIFHVVSVRSNEFTKFKTSFRKLVPVFLIAEVLNLVAEFTLNLATSRGPVSLVKIIEGIQPIFVLLIAVVMYPFFPKFFREAKVGSIARKLIIMALGIVGVLIIGLSS